MTDQLHLFETPPIEPLEQEVIARVEDIRKSVKYMLSSSRRWTGLLARATLARSIRGSNSIEGYNVSVSDAIAAVAGEEPTEANQEVWLAVTHYRQAMTYILNLADDLHFSYDESLIRGLHYMMLAYDLPKNPGKWRPGNVHVQREATGEIVYEGPDAEMVPALMRLLTERLNQKDGTPPLIKAAMAHLNLVMVHPFSDGNGRMARALQTLVLVREEQAVLDKEFSSIEEYLGMEREAYYQALSTVGGTIWNPNGDARPFVQFCLTAHLRQADRLLRRSRRLGQIWNEVEEEVKRRSLPDRVTYALAEAALGFKVRNATYRALPGINKHLASRDLKMLVDAGLLIPEGERRGRLYTWGDFLKEINARAHKAFPVRVSEDPFKGQPDLFEMKTDE